MFCIKNWQIISEIFATMKKQSSSGGKIPMTQFCSFKLKLFFFFHS